MGFETQSGESATKDIRKPIGDNSRQELPQHAHSQQFVNIGVCQTQDIKLHTQSPLELEKSNRNTEHTRNRSSGASVSHQLAIVMKNWSRIPDEVREAIVIMCEEAEDV